MEQSLPSPISIEAPAGKAFCVFKKGCALPVNRLVYFTTSRDAQTSVELNVLKGEGLFVSENEQITKLHISDLPSAPKGVVRIEIEFRVDKNGTLTFRASEYPSRKTLRVVQT
jgi:molecular chaperone DnaK